MELLFPQILSEGGIEDAHYFVSSFPSVESRNNAGHLSNGLASRRGGDSTLVGQERSGGYRFEVPDLFTVFRPGTDNQPIEVTRP
jgi:hypothetical protein